MTDRDRLMRQDINESSDKGSQRILPGAGAHTDNQDNSAGAKLKKYKWYIVGAVVVFLVALIIGLTVGGKDEPSPPGPGPDPLPPGPEPLPPGYNPYHFDDVSFEQTPSTAKGNLIFSQELHDNYHSVVKTMDDGKLTIDAKDIPQGENNKLIKYVSFEFGQVDFKTSMLTFTDATQERWSIPEGVASKPGPSNQMRLDMNNLHIFKNPFGFEFVDNRDKSNVLLSTEKSTFVMYDKYLQMDIQLPSRRIYGFGERNHEFTLQQGTWTMWSNAQEMPYDTGMGGLQTYSVHPFVLVQTKVQGEFMGIYFRNSNAQSPIITHYGDSAAELSYITTGGQMEVYFFFQGTAKQIISQYQKLIGKAQLPPMWSLGWHACSYAYSTQELLEENIKGYKSNKFPLEGVWLDIDYTNDYDIFTVNTTAFPTIKALTTQLQADGKKVIPIVDAGLNSHDAQNKYYSDAFDKNLLLKSTANADMENGILTTKIFSNDTVFLDFFDDRSKDVWGEGLRDLHALIPYDGIWLDMNEPVSFCNGECPQDATESTAPTKEQVIKDKLVNLFDGEILNKTWFYQYTDQSDNSTYALPFIAGRWNLDNQTISLNATHPSDPSLTEYNVHSLFGHTQGKMTYEIISNETLAPADLKDKRAFVLSRSTFPGSGQYVSTWSGDIHRTWGDMKTSIATIMNSQMFGIPLAGADVCGFYGEAGQEELCARWVQLSQFYPFARQHRDKTGGGGNNEIWRMSEPYYSMAKDTLYARLQWVRQVYGCLFRMHDEGYTCFDPLFFHYPNLGDEGYANPDHTFIVADALKVSPVLEAGVEKYNAYFPNGRWVSMKNLGEVVEVKGESGGAYVELTAPADTVNVHLMPGKITVFQDNSDQSKELTSDMLNDQDITLILNRDQYKHAEGRVFLDDGVKQSSLINQEYLHYDFQHNEMSLFKHVHTQHDSQYTRGFNIDKIVIADAADLKNVDTFCYVNSKGETIDLTGTFDAKMMTLTINGKINFIEMERLHYLQAGVHLNLCNLSSNFYATFATPDLTGAFYSMELTSTSQSQEDIIMEFTVLETGVVNIHWTYDPQTEHRKRAPFEVPSEIIDVDRTPATDKKLEDWISIEKDETTGMVKVTVMGIDKKPAYTLNGFQLGEYFSHIDATVIVDSDHFKGVMGIFEQTTSDLFLKDGIYSLWNRDEANPVQNGKLPATNTYGSHPFMMAKTKSVNKVNNGWIGVYYNLANAQDWRIQNNAGAGQVSVKTFATGGVGDLFFMMGDGPNTVTTLYQTVVGKPVMVPQWSLGWNQGRYGYTNLDAVKESVKNFSDYDLPLDTQWSDIDYYDRNRIFTFDPVNYKGLGEFVIDLHTKGMKWIPILDTAVAKRSDGSYEIYNDGVANDVFIKTDQGSVFTGQVKPNDVAFPDFMKPATVTWWTLQLDIFYNMIPFDGLWTDRNEAFQLCDGVCYQNEQAANPVNNKLPYIPTGRNLEHISIPLDAKHEGGFTELDTHSLFGAYQSKATHEWFKINNKRTMIIERSAFAGTGKFASRFLGRNFATQESMGNSITGVMQHNIIGMPLVGSDICGYYGNTTAELCARWYTVGAFYPFSRNYNDWGLNSQEPWMFQSRYEASVSYFDIIKKAMYTKFHMIRYYYSEMIWLSVDGGAFFKPLFMEFPDDNMALDASQENNVMLGAALKLSVNSNMLNQNTTDFYFPAGQWCNLLKGTGTTTCFYSAGETKTMNSKAYDAYVHLREGYIAPMQDGTKLGEEDEARTTKDLQDHPVDFHINPSCETDCTANGRYLNDDGEVLDITNNINIYTMSYTHSNATTSEKPDTLTLTVTQVAKASNMDKNIVNKNDHLQSVYINRATSLNLNANTYIVKVYLADGSSVAYSDATTYDAKWDRLAFTDKGLVPIELPNIAKIELTKV